MQYDVTAVQSHLCLLNPVQRGPVDDISTPGSQNCYFVAGPCGGQKAHPGARTILPAKSSLNVIFQKNLDHYNSTNPGYFQINIGQDERHMREVMRMNDTSDGSGHIYTTQVTLPPNLNQGDGYILQMTYVSNTVPITFYQCADILVLTMMIKAVIIVCILAISDAHLCLISPPQRGSMNGLNTAGSDDCILTSAPCGGRERKERSGEGFAAGENVTVTFQKNLDHFNSQSPGYFTVSLGSPSGQLQELARIPDGGEKSLHLYSMNVTLPREPQAEAGHFMQVVYHTNNPQAPPNFYQCADIVIARRPPPRK
ncbi:hypothetical protein KUTeg_019009 [Tegillarca granosa]|uniref:Copper acquisition factor BIM1-like domain-containing protein n=1 Tax=Tegillarca granosa TaxID=220873 RepID=A0ABQ9EB93_TEGGR|nr:hypothetical protein KUTeg_019009 [Tegillarca granosa]